MAPPAADVVGLSLLLVALTLAAPGWLARQRWVELAPRVALLTWLALLGAWALAVVGVHLAVVLAPLGRPLLPALGLGLPALAGGHLVLPGSSLLAAGVAAAVLLWCLARGGAVLLRAATGRRRARRAVLLAAEHDAESDLHVLPLPTVTAFCVPGRPALVVVSQGFLDTVPAAERAAVLAHERAHATGHWHLVPLLARAWAACLPGLAGPGRAVEATTALVEIACDAEAVRVTGPRAMRRALGLLGAPVPTGPGRRGGHGLVSWQPAGTTITRLRRLTRAARETDAVPLAGAGRAAARLGRVPAGAVAVGLAVSSLVLLVGPAVLMAR